MLEEGIHADLSMVKAWKGDKGRNLGYRKTSRNFNPMIATCGKVTVAEVEQLVEVGHRPRPFHPRESTSTASVQGASYEKRIEFRTLAGATAGRTRRSANDGEARGAGLRDGYYVNLGIGIPTLVANYSGGRQRHAAVGKWPARHRPVSDAKGVDPDLINAGKHTVTTIPARASSQLRLVSP